MSHILSALDTPSFSSHLSSIKTLNRTNFEEWNETLLVVLAIFCMMIMRLSMNKTIKNYLAAVSKKFVVFNKAEKGNYMRLLTTPLAFVCFESNLVDIPLNSWWVDTGASIHVTNSLHGFKSKRRPYDGEVAVYMGNEEKALVEFIGVVNLPLASGGVLVLDDVVYVPSLRRSLISVSKLDSSGFGFHFGNKRFVLYSGSREIASSALCDGLYKLDLDPNYPSSHNVFATIGSKRVNDEFSSMLWHRRLGHISRERMERLTRNGILDSLNFSDFQTCVDCVKGKLTRARKKGATRSEGLLEIIHTNICGPFTPSTLAEIELKQEKKIKIVRSDRGGEFYGRYGEARQIPGPFAKFLQELRPYDPSLKKLDPRSVSGYFVGYANKSKGYRFYCPSYSMRIVESKRAVFLEGDSVNEVVQPSRFAFEEERVAILVPPSLESAVSLPLTKYVDEAIPIVIEAQPIDDALLRRSQRSRKPAISDDYMVYLQEHEFDIGVVDDPSSYSQAIQSSQSTKWIDAMVDELKSMDNNNVWDLVDLPNGCRPIGCKWVFKTKKDSTGKIERYKARLVAKGFSQKEGVNYKETFSLVSSKNSFRIVMALVAHFDFELHQMDVKKTFLNGDLIEDVYMLQPDGFQVSGNEHMVCKRKKSIYGLKQASRQWRSDLFEVVGYADADYAGYADDLKSTSGYVFMLARGAISWKSVKQTLTASSTVQAEYVACYEATLQAVWLRNFISRLEIVDSISKPLTIYNDNSTAVCFSKNNKRSSGLKHMHIKYLVVREKILELQTSIIHIAIEEMIADPLTKGLPPKVFKEHVTHMGFVESFDIFG
uniref:Integrase catalytic domain-containing protein n=1 Tax=Fagus sylvatica TaxID=28930 RepID=A0A2N9EWH4_FAGSY